MRPLDQASWAGFVRDIKTLAVTADKEHQPAPSAVFSKGPNVFVHQGEETNFMLLSFLSLCFAKITPFGYATLLTSRFSKQQSALRALTT